MEKSSWQEKDDEVRMGYDFPTHPALQNREVLNGIFAGKMVGKKTLGMGENTLSNDLKNSWYLFGISSKSTILGGGVKDFFSFEHETWGR